MKTDKETITDAALTLLYYVNVQCNRQPPLHFFLSSNHTFFPLISPVVPSQKKASLSLLSHQSNLAREALDVEVVDLHVAHVAHRWLVPHGSGVPRVVPEMSRRRRVKELLPPEAKMERYK